MRRGLVSVAVALTIAVTAPASAAPRVQGGPLTTSCPCVSGSAVHVQGDGYDPAGLYAATWTKPDGTSFMSGVAADDQGHLAFAATLVTVGGWTVTVVEGYGRVKWQLVASVAFQVA